MEFFLERLDAKHSARLPLRGGAVSIGRNPQNTVVLSATDRCVSGYHAVIYADPQRMLLQDLQSTNGTFVNGRQVQECVLEAGDEVGFGKSGPRFRVGADGGDGGISGINGANGINNINTINNISSINDANCIDADITENPFDDTNTNVNRKPLPATGKRAPSCRSAAAIIAIAVLTALTAVTLALIPVLFYPAGKQPAPAKKDFFSPQPTITPSMPELNNGNIDTSINADPSISYQTPAAFATAEKINSVLMRFGEEAYRVPPEMAERVEHYLNRYQGAMRRTVALWIERGGRYFPMIRSIFAEKNIPLELAYVSMLESGFNTEAVSHAGAVGMWQFMPHTARRYGLRVGGGVDERTDPEKATRAAAAYFKDLIAIFGSRSSVMLCMAAYNAGEQRVINALKKIDDPVRDRDFWHLYRMGWLAEETNEYIPQVIALIIIHDNPGEYGF
ncbi:MAG: transglycosylase SLT domain-containing protein [Chitinispirillales bacterium]|jgi:hypothetical protein|nr:transglycosylase SLT domain-containing protein [Chitinispirillales bacterium]